MLKRIVCAALLIAATAPVLAQEFCATTPEGIEAAKRAVAEIQSLSRPVIPVQGLWPLDEKIRELNQFPPATKMLPWGSPALPYMYGPGSSTQVPEFSQYGQPERADDMPEDIKRDLIPDASKCLGQYKCLHDELHPYYKVAFRKLGCHCHTGKCRPTEARRVDTSADNETGYQVLANGRWCDVPAAALRRDRHKIPETLLQFRAHVCVSETSCAQLECAIIDEGT